MSSPVIVLQAGFSARPSLQRRAARPEFYKSSGKFYFWDGYLDRREAASLYSAFLIPALARTRGGLDSTPSQGSTYGAAADAEITRAAMEFIPLMAKGDATAVKSLLQHYVVVTPAIRGVLARLGPAPPLLRPVYSTADRLSPPAR